MKIVREIAESLSCEYQLASLKNILRVFEKVMFCRILKQILLLDDNTKIQLE